MRLPLLKAWWESRAFPALLLLVVVAAGPALSQTKAGAQGEYKIGAGDVLDIRVWKNEELSMSVPVRPDGWISLPLVNDLKVSGLTPMQLREKLTEILEEYVSSPVVSVIVTQVNSFRVSVLGKVKAQGRLQLDGPTTVLEAIAIAGGFDEFSSRDDTYVLRPGGSGYRRIPVRYSDAIRPEGTSVNIRLEPGDIIIVP